MVSGLFVWFRMLIFHWLIVDASQFRPGVSIYGPTLPTPLTLETVEKALRGLPHMKSVSELVSTFTFIANS